MKEPVRTAGICRARTSESISAIQLLWDMVFIPVKYIRQMTGGIYAHIRRGVRAIKAESEVKPNDRDKH